MVLAQWRPALACVVTRSGGMVGSATGASKSARAWAQSVLAFSYRRQREPSGACRQYRIEWRRNSQPRDRFDSRRPDNKPAPDWGCRDYGFPAGYPDTRGDWPRPGCSGRTGMKLLGTLALASVLMACCLPGAHAIGDSGGCGDPLGGRLGTALKSGNSQAIEAALNDWLDYREKSLSTFKRLSLQAGGADARRTWRNQLALNLIEGNHEKGETCVPGALLPVAMNAGNVEGTQYLLNQPVGVKPSVPARVLFTCNDEYPADEKRARRRQAFALVLDTERVNINARIGERNRTALETCHDVALLSLFLERGATLDTESEFRFEVLDQAIESAVTTEENSYIARRARALERAKFFSERITRSIRGRKVEARARHSCNLVIREKRWNPMSCAELAKFIVAAPGTFGDP